MSDQQKWGIAMSRETFMRKVDAALASHNAERASSAGGPTFAEEVIPVIQRLAEIARDYALDLRQRGFAFDVVDRSVALEVAFVGRSGNWSLLLAEHSDAPNQLTFVTGMPPYTREVDPGSLAPSQIADALFESKLEEFIEKVMKEELPLR
jgi:hypothetical protein